MHSSLATLVSGASFLSGLWSPLTTGFALAQETTKIDHDVHAICLAHERMPSFLNFIGYSSKDPAQVTLFDVLGLDPMKTPFYPVVESIRPIGKTWKEAEQALKQTEVYRQEVWEVFNKTDEWKVPLPKRSREFWNTLVSMSWQEMAHVVLADEQRRVLYQVGFLPLIESPGGLQEFCAKELAGEGDRAEL